jgi:hypothetical protein
MACADDRQFRAPALKRPLVRAPEPGSNQVSHSDHLLALQLRPFLV